MVKIRYNGSIFSRVFSKEEAALMMTDATRIKSFLEIMDTFFAYARKNNKKEKK
jgi:hypothetical protein